jgi:hypothetical protein
VGTCNKCGKTGHKAVDCRQKANGKFNGNCHKCGKAGHKAQDCRSTNTNGFKGKCHNCGKVGHKQFECKAPQSGDSPDQKNGGGTQDSKHGGPDNAVKRSINGALMNCCNLQENERLVSFVSVNVNGKDVPVCLDTGCLSKDKMNIMTPELASRLNLQTFEDTPGPLAVGGGQSMEPRAACWVPLKFEKGQVTRRKFYISTIPFPILLGWETMMDMGLLLDGEKGTVSFKKIGAWTLPLLKANSFEFFATMLNMAPMVSTLDDVRRLERLPDTSLEEGRERVRQLQEKYSTLFDDNTGADVPPIELNFKEQYTDKVVNIPERRRPKCEEEAIERHTLKMLERGIVRKCRGPHNFQVVLAPKGEDPYGRFCVNYAALSKLLAEDYHWPIPKIKELLDRLSGMKVFTKLDFRDGFWQLPIKKEHQDRLAFTTRSGKFTFKFLPFGVKVASEKFQETMIGTSQEFAELLWVYVQIYIDDMLLATITVRANVAILETVFKTFNDKNFKLRLEKCMFLQPEVKYVGFIVDKDGIRPDPEKVEAIEKIPLPTTKKMLHNFLAHSQWHLRDFTPLFGMYSAALWPLTSANVKDFKKAWAENEEKYVADFNELKSLCRRELLNAHFDDDKPCDLIIDASSEDSLCACLVQDGKLIAVASRNFKKHEKKWIIHEKEAKAILYGCRKFRRYLIGRKFTVWTDHESLVGVWRNVEVTNERVLKIKLQTAEFDLEVKWVKGEQNIADFWTRLGLKDAKEKRKKRKFEVNNPVCNVIAQLEWNCSQADVIEIENLNKRDGSLGTEVNVKGKWKLFVPERSRRALVYDMHKDRHFGVTKNVGTVAKILLEEYGRFFARIC